MVAVEIVSETEIAKACTAVYQFLLAALDKPSQRQFEWLRGDEFRNMLTQLCESFAVLPPDDEFTPEDFAEFESRYLACFDVGLPTPPVPLQASHYNRRQPAQATIHEHVLFYQQFGLHPTTGNSEPGDHLSNELAFLIHLDERALRQPEQRQPIMQARRDFLKRQAGQWPARAAELAADNGLPAIYVTILSILALAIDQDSELTSAALAEPSEEKRP